MPELSKRPFSSYLLLLALVAGRLAAWSADTNQLLDLSPWTWTSDFRGSLGYKDNVLLSANAPVDSPFWASELELFLFRIPVDGAQVTVLLSGEDIRFFNSQAPDKEQTVIALASVKQDFARYWKAGLTLQYIYQDQVFDASTTEFGLSSVKAQIQSFSVRPSLRRDLGSQQYAELEAGLERHNFNGPLDDFWEGGPKLTLGQEYGPNSKISLSYELRRWDYENRPNRTATGAAAPGSLSFIRHDWDLTWQQPWDRSRRWRTTTKLGFSRNTDSGVGYFDYNRYRVSEQLRYVADPWEAKLLFRFEHYAYPVQAATELDPTKRTKDGIGISFWAERKFTKALRAFAQFEYDLSLSNRPEEEYAVNTVRIGVDWTF